MTTRYDTHHLEIEGDTIDRDHGYPELELIIVPIGTDLPADRQSRELHVLIGAKKTVIGEEGIDALYEFLGDHGARRRIEVSEMEAPAETLERHRFISTGIALDAPCGFTPGDGPGLRCAKPRNDPRHLL